jgi:hypothetical protein
MSDSETTCSSAVAIDSPNTTSSVTYNVYITPTTSSQFRWRNGSMLLQEIAG